MATSTKARTHYEVLHVSRDAPLEIIRSTYRTLMQKLGNHPDLGGDTKTAAAINEAYAVLANAERRAEYDAQLDLVAQVTDMGPEDSQDSKLVEKPMKALDPSRECVFCRWPHTQGEFIHTDACCQNCDSPLSRAENPRLESESRRAVARINKHQSISFYTCWPQHRALEGVTENISLNGMRIATPSRLKQGQRLKIVSATLEAVADVSNCRLERRGWRVVCIAGVSFVTIRFIRSTGGFVSHQV